jgi:hypothetical protein
VEVGAGCDNACAIKARGTLKLNGVKGRLALRPASKRAAAGETVELGLRLGTKARKRIRRSKARRGTAKVSVTAVDSDDTELIGKTSVRLRR